MRNTTSVLASSPLPLSVMVWPGLAEASAPFSGVPLAAVAPMLARLTPKAALVPPTVLTRIGPVGTPEGTVRLMAVLVLNTSSPALRLTSAMLWPPISTLLAPSAKPLPASCRL